jgi:hypothetical protein
MRKIILLSKAQQMDLEGASQRLKSVCQMGFLPDDVEVLFRKK